jgi:DNA polymerase III subunit delta
MAAPIRTPVASFLVSFGAENLLLDRDIERARAWTNREIVMVDGDGLTDHELVSICESRGFDSSPRTIIVEDAQKMKGDKSLREYIKEKVPTDLTTVLVGIVRAEKLPEVWALAISKGKGYEHKKLKTWDSNNEVLKWIAKEADRLRLSWDKGIDLLVYRYVGSDLYRLANELKKLAIVAGPQGKITQEHLRLVTSPTPTSDPFQVAEAALSKDPKKALNALSVLYKNSGDEAHVPVVGALMKQVERTLVVRRLIDKGASKEDIGTAIGMKPWLVENVALPTARKHEVGALIRHMGRLCKLDVDVKGPARSKRTLVELTVLAIAG